MNKLNTINKIKPSTMRASTLSSTSQDKVNKKKYQSKTQG